MFTMAQQTKENEFPIISHSEMQKGKRMRQYPQFNIIIRKTQHRKHLSLTKDVYY